MMERNITLLLNKEDAFWWNRQFANDPMKGRLTDNQQKEFIAMAVESGKRAANEYLLKFGRCEPSELADRLGITVRSEESCGTQNYIFYATYAKPELITIYEENFRKFDQYLANNKLELDITGKIARDLVLSHEIYHYYEQTHPENDIGKLRFVSHRLGPFKLKSKLIAPEEIAAMTFARELTGVSFNPCCLNILLLLPHDSKKALELLLPPKEQFKLRTEKRKKC